MMSLQADDIIRILGLEVLPHEGGMWVQSHQDRHSSAIYFLIREGDFSAMHRLTGPEIWHFYAGSPVQMLMLFPDGHVLEPVLGGDLAADQRPQVVVPPGVWQGASSTGAWSLLGTTMAPPYVDDGFELGGADALGGEFPISVDRIRALTRG
jgi:predicted cupin superfamily sugar epimerase